MALNVKRAERVALWLKTHSASERAFGQALDKFFSEQADRIADTVRDNYVGGLPSPDQVPLIFNHHDEHERLAPVIRRNLTGLLIAGARNEARASGRRLEGKAAGDDFDSLNDLELPFETMEAIKQSLSDLQAQAYWENIQTQTERNLAAIIEQGIVDKLSNHALSVLIRNELGGYAARKRGMTIARTETTGAMNAGHMAYAESLIEDGIVEGKEWSGIADSDARASHQALNGVVVKARENFSVGGWSAPYPGHFSLPARERVNCRCVVLSVFTDDLMED